MTVSLDPPLGKRLAPAWRYGAALGFVACSALAAEVMYRAFDTTRLSMVFLAGVLFSAFYLGSGPGYFAAVLSFLIYNIYLVEPRFTFQLVTAEDVLVLLVFGAVAVLTGRLAGRVRDEAKRAESRARTAAALFEASRDLSSVEDETAIRERLARHIGRAAKGEAAVWDARGAAHGDLTPEVSAELVARAREAVGPATGTAQIGDWRMRPLSADPADMGYAGWRATQDQEGLVEAQLINVLVDLGAAAIARARLADAHAEVEAARRTEQLRNALLSSISHDLRTPLAAILASASSLREFDAQFSPAVRADLVVTIEEEAERLNRFVANLLNMTKLESGALAVSFGPVGVAEVLERVRAGAERRRRAREIRQVVEGEELQALGDPVLLEQALGNVLENALRFSPDGTTITLSARPADGDRVLIEAADEGPGVPASDLALIFEKFYRSPATSSELQGTGLGLSIAQGLIAAMNGEVSARARDDGAPGLVVSLLLPRARA